MLISLSTKYRTQASSCGLKRKKKCCSSHENNCTDANNNKRIKYDDSKYFHYAHNNNNKAYTFTFKYAFRRYPGWKKIDTYY